ncbi:hypothetical protein [Pseudonocardia sp. D17]|uniref:hypothetical protein n=1 Tax=Pseudonocardia sp. D17 TaxID=882661 RepID=UPI002B37622A|nr:hypothetical protein PSD17_56360 [Pseudonocardia sp. D17]
MRRAVWVGVVLGVAVLGAGCGVDRGRIVGKGYDPAATYTTIMTIGGCPCYPVVDTEPECWRLDLRDGDDTGSVCVDRRAWDAAYVGGYWGDRG